jgi:hypothetical protein
MTVNTPKIRGFLAEKNNSAVFLYRKKNKVTYLLSLNYQSKKDVVVTGSKFHGNIYPNRCGISPDGRYFIYFAMGSGKKGYDRNLYTWTAICEPPKITALLLVGHNDTYSGGGHFIDEKSIFLSAGVYTTFENSLTPGNKAKFGKYNIIIDSNYNHGGWDSHSNGWIAAETNKQGFAIAWKKENDYYSILKSVKKNWIKQGEYSMHEYVISSAKGEKCLDAEDITWADIDNYGRLMIASGSKLKIFSDKRALLKDQFEEIDFESFITNP